MTRLSALTNLSQRKIATAFGVSQAMVSAAVKRFPVVEDDTDQTPIATAA